MSNTSFIVGFGTTNTVMSHVFYFKEMLYTFELSVHQIIWEKRKYYGFHRNVKLLSTSIIMIL